MMKSTNIQLVTELLAELATEIRGRVSLEEIPEGIDKCHVVFTWPNPKPKPSPDEPGFYGYQSSRTLGVEHPIRDLRTNPIFLQLVSEQDQRIQNIRIKLIELGVDPDK